MSMCGMPLVIKGIGSVFEKECLLTKNLSLQVNFSLSRLCKGGTPYDGMCHSEALLIKSMGFVSLQRASGARLISTQG
eukprot:1681252-Amphidinium_carterae.1